MASKKIDWQKMSVYIAMKKNDKEPDKIINGCRYIFPHPEGHLNKCIGMEVKGYNNVRLGGTWRDRLKGWLIYIKSIFQMMRK